MEEKMKIVRKRLERLVENDRISRKETIRLSFDKKIKSEERVRNANYFEGVDDSYKTICEQFNVPYEPIKSDIN